MKKGDAHKSFCKTYVKKSPSQFLSHWKKMMFTGKGQMPTALANEEDMINAVAEAEGAIGYVSAGKETDQAKTITVK